MRISKGKRHGLSRALVLACMAAVPALAEAQTWTGAGGNSNYSTNANWSGNAFPVNAVATAVNFGSTSTNTNVNMTNAVVSVGTISFTNFNYTLTQPALTTNSVTVSSTGTAITTGSSGSGSFAIPVTIAGEGATISTGAVGGTLSFNGGLTVNAASSVNFSPAVGRSININGTALNPFNLPNGPQVNFNNGTTVLSATSIVANAGTDFFAFGTLVQNGVASLPRTTAFGLNSLVRFTNNGGGLPNDLGAIQSGALDAQVPIVASRINLSIGGKLIATATGGTFSSTGGVTTSASGSSSAIVISAPYSNTSTGARMLVTDGLNAGVDLDLAGPLLGANMIVQPTNNPTVRLSNPNANSLMRQLTFSGAATVQIDTANALNPAGNTLSFTGTGASITSALPAGPVLPTTLLTITGGTTSLATDLSVNRFSISSSGVFENQASVLTTTGTTNASSLSSTATFTNGSSGIVNLSSRGLSNSGALSNIGSISGNITNGASGTVYNSGLIVGTLTNSGTVSWNAFGTSLFGTYIHNGGTLDYTNTGTFLVQSGGITINTDLTLSNSGSGGQFGVSDTTSPIVNNAVLNLNGNLLFAGLGAGGFVNNRLVTGGGLLSGTFPAGDYTNAATWNVTADLQLLAARLINAGGNLSVTNNVQLRIAPGSQIENSGTLTITDAQIKDGGTLINTAAGQIVGRGTIASAFTQAGVLSPSGGTLNVTLPFTNTGTIRMQFGGQLAGGQIFNQGRIQGDGFVSNPINNITGRVQPTGTLVLGSALTNQVAGNVQVTVGNTLVTQAGFAANTNAGIITLAGGEIDTNGFTLTNAPTGQVTGFGTVSTGGLRNSGAVTLTGGVSVFNGTVTNDASRNFRIQYNPAIFTGLFTNNGNLFVTQTTATFAGGYAGGAPAALKGGDGVPAANPFAPSLSGLGVTTVSPGASLLVDGLVQSALVVQGQVGAKGQVQVVSRQPGGYLANGGRSVPQSLSVVSTLAIDQSAGQYLGFVDLADNDLVVRGGSAQAIGAMVAAWYNGGAHTTVGLGSSEASPFITLGVFPNSIPGAVGSPAYYDTYGGMTLAATDVVVKFTYLGDTNIDGVVDAKDLVAVLEGLSTGATGWRNGDLNYDGVVNGTDLTLLGASMSATLPQLGQPSAGGAGGGAVPEPGAVAGLLLPAAQLGRRRRRAR